MYIKWRLFIYYLFIGGIMWTKKRKLISKRIVILLTVIAIMMIMTTPALAATTDKYFSFKIRYSVTSSNFNISNSTVKISASANVINNDTGVVVSGYGSHEWRVNLYSTALFGKNVSSDGTIDSGVSGTFTGFNTSQNHKVTIINVDYLPSTRRLKGSGTIKSY